MSFHTTLLMNVLLALLIANCENPTNETFEFIQVPEAKLQVPILKGWTDTRKSNKQNNSRNEIILQLVTEHQVPGSPKVTLAIEPAKSDQTLDQFKQHITTVYDTIKKQTNLNTISFTETPTTLAGNQAIQLDEIYTLESEQSIISISQMTLLTRHNNLNISITANGRTELFTPFQVQIQTIISHISAIGKT